MRPLPALLARRRACAVLGGCPSARIARRWLCEHNIIPACARRLRLCLRRPQQLCSLELVLWSGCAFACMFVFVCD